MNKWQKITGTVCLALALAACGGGDDNNSGGGGGSNASVPASPTKSLSNSDTEARMLAENTVEGSGDNVTASRRQNQLDGFSKLAGVTADAGANAANAQAAKAVSMMSARFSGKASGQVNCADLVAGNNDEPADQQIRDCSGSVSFDTNIDDNSIDGDGEIAAGTFVAITFNNLGYTTDADGPVSINGTLRVEYVERFVANPPSGKLRYQAVNLSGSAAGESFGPENLDFIISFNGDNVEVIADGVRLTDFEASYNDADNYTIAGGSVIDQIGDDYIQIDYSNWRVVDGVPQTGSRLTVTGTNGTATVEVLGNSGSIVTMRISINAEGRTSDYDLQINITNGSVTVI